MGSIIVILTVFFFIILIFIVASEIGRLAHENNPISYQGKNNILDDKLSFRFQKKQKLNKKFINNSWVTLNSPIQKTLPLKESLIKLPVPKEQNLKMFQE